MTASDPDGFTPAPRYGEGEPNLPARRSRSAITALVLGVLSIPLAITVYLGLLAGVIGVVFGIIGLTRTRPGRSTGRGMAVAGLACGVVGLIISVALLAYGLKTFKDCQDRLGHRPTTAELRECARS